MEYLKIQLGKDGATPKYAAAGSHCLKEGAFPEASRVELKQVSQRKLGPGTMEGKAV